MRFTRLPAFFAVLGSSLLLGACVTAPAPKAVALRPLASPASLGSDRVVNQVVRAVFGSREATFNCVVTVKDGAMTVVGLSAVGMRLFTIRYDGDAVQSETSPGIPEHFEPERLLADLQLAFWPLAKLQKAYQGWQLSEPAPGTRRLRRGEKLIAEVHYGNEDAWSGRSWLVNFEYGYSLQIDSRAL
jgi:hypothetical protein